MMDMDRRCRQIGMGHGMARLKTVKCKLRGLSKRRNSGMFANLLVFESRNGHMLRVSML